MAIRCTSRIPSSTKICSTWYRGPAEIQFTAVCNKPVYLGIRNSSFKMSYTRLLRLHRRVVESDLAVRGQGTG
jgi:hypothetical protein